MLNNPRHRFYALTGGLALLFAAVFVVTWIMMAGHVPVPPRQAIVVPPSKPAPQVAPPTAVPVFAPPVKTVDRRAIDPEIQRLADELAEKNQTPARDLEIVGEFISLYTKVFKQGNPIGLNEDITAVLTGQNEKKGVLFPPNNSMIVKGQLVDRWGTPYWFHPSSSWQMEIRSAGPDKNLFNADDVVLNPSHGDIGLNQQAMAQ
eukprot:gene7461-9241_t